MYKGFMALRESAEEIVSFVEMSIISGIDLPCFQGRDRVISELRDRFKLDLNKEECKSYVKRMIEGAADSWRTNMYDTF